MDTISQVATRKTRLNPFAFPSDTTFRFVLLIVSVVGTSLFAYNWLFYVVFGEEFDRVYGQCQEEVATAYPLPNISPTIDPMAYIDQQAARIQALDACVQPIEYVQFAFIASGVVLFLIVATGLYWTAPARKIRREELEPLSDEDSPEMLAYLTDLCQEAGLARPPTFLLNPHNRSNGGLAFGRLGRYYVVLNSGLVIQFAVDRSAFRAVVLHELSHLRNADVNKTYFALATWQAFIITALVPFSVSLIYYLLHSLDLGFVLGIAWRVLALTALVYLTRSAVLRAREVYADVRASVWDGPSGALERVLATQSPKEDRWRDVLKEGRWRDVLDEGRRWAMLRLHPDPDERRRALAEPHKLLRMGFWEAFGTGVAATIAFANVVFLLHLVIAAEQATLVPLATALLFAPLAVGVVGLGAWRGTFAALAGSEAPRGIGRLGLGLGLGIILGQIISLGSSVSSAEGEQGNASFFFYVLWGTLILISTFFFVRWIAAGASVWLEVVITRRSLRLIYVLGLAVAAGLLTWWLGTLFLYFDLGVGGDFDYVQNNPLVMIANLAFFGPNALIAGLTFTFLMLISLWAFPLAARFWSKRVAVSSESSWAFLDPSPQPLTLPQRPPLRPDLALIIGLIGGLLFCGLMLLIRAGLHFALSDAVKNTPQTKLWFFVGQVALAVLLQLIVAAVGAIWVKRLGWAHGLCAVFVAGCIMTIGSLGLAEVSDCVPILGITGQQQSCSIVETDPSFAVNTLRYMTIWGTLLSLPVAVGVSAIRGANPTIRGNQEPGTWNKTRVLGVAAATVAALIIGAPAFATDMLSLPDMQMPNLPVQGSLAAQQASLPQQNYPLQESDTIEPAAPANAANPASPTADSSIAQPATAQQQKETKSSPKMPAATPKADATMPSSGLPGASLDPAFTPLLPTLQQLTTASIILPEKLPTQLKNVAIGQDTSGSPRSTSGNRYTILFLAQPPREVVQPYVHAYTAGTLTALPQPRTIPPNVTTTSRGTVTLLDGVEATLQVEEGPAGSNMGRRSVGTFENNGWTYTLDLPAGGNYPPELVEEVLSTMVLVAQSEKPNNENSVGSEAGLRQAVEDYYRAVDRKDWNYTYDKLDTQTQQRLTRSEWSRKNQYLANLDPLERSTPKIASKVSSSSPVEVTLTQTFRSGTTGSRSTYFVWEGGSWKHRFSQEEYNLFMADDSYEEFVRAKQSGL